MSSFIAAMLLMFFIPAFDRRPDRKTQSRIKRSVHYKNNKFVNDIPTSTRMSWHNQLSILWDFARGKPADGRPSSPIELVMTDIENTQPLSDFNQAIWFGHSSVLICFDGLRSLFLSWEVNDLTTTCRLMLKICLPLMQYFLPMITMITWIIIQ